MTPEDAEIKVKTLEIEQAILEDQSPLFPEFEEVHETRKMYHLRRLRNAQRRLERLKGDQHE